MNTPESEITNDKLARMYIDVMSRTSRSVDSLQIAANQIRRCPFQIADVFERGGSLSEVRIPKFAKSHYVILELILREGVDKAGEAVVRADVVKTKRMSFQGIPGAGAARVAADDTSPSWENSTRALEEGRRLDE
jgi:hypothetical protein